MEGLSPGYPRVADIGVDVQAAPVTEPAQVALQLA